MIPGRRVFNFLLQRCEMDDPYLFMSNDRYAYMYAYIGRADVMIT